jgi:hypothetical protein
VHWHSFQVPILDHITFCVDPTFGSNDKDKTFIKESHFYILDDKEHDTLFIQHCLLQHWNWFTSQSVRPLHHTIWNDKCVGQFKRSKVMYFVFHYLGLISSCKWSWHYFSIRHGKGEWDSASVVVNRALRVEQLHNPQRRFQDAIDVVEFLLKKCLFEHLAHMREIVLLSLGIFGMSCQLMLIDQPLIFFIAYMVHKSCIPYLVFPLLTQQ